MLYSTFVARVKEKILDRTIFRLPENKTFAIALAEEAEFKSYACGKTSLKLIYGDLDFPL
jgi:hypothetical protein